ncbi:MAG: diguanylate cyclase [Gammaproteobacteria bacterium]|nr:diguanylate cyclase [Gammaproteobacteria bacterium]
MKIQTLLFVAYRIAIILITIEILLLFLFQTIPNDLSTNELAILNTVTLVLASTPLISIFVIKPFLEANARTLAKIRNVATTDPLTQLANRRLVVEHLDRVVAGCTRHHEYCAVLLINLDDFKKINEDYGYDAGDAVLVEVARRLHATIRANDIVGRMDGDEFIVLLERLETDVGITGDRVQQIANKLIAMINMPIAVKSKAVHVSASIGIRLLGFEPINTDTVILEADSAMYRAKEKGGSRAVIFNKKAGAEHKRDLDQTQNQQMSIC